jgi:hypothetical protein
MNAKGTINSYLQLNLQNQSSGSGASSDVVATNNTAGDTEYIDMGINSSANTSTGVLGAASTAYLHTTGRRFAIGNSTPSDYMLFFTTPTAGIPTERMRIISSGQVGVGMTPLTTAGITLFVSGNVQANGTTLTSDRRLKKNIATLNYGLTDILK